jgi:hypothetical protein
MDLAELKNMDIKDLLSKFKGSGGILDDKKLLVKFGIGFGSIIIFLIIYYVFVSPEVYDRKTRIDVMNKNHNKIAEYNNNIVRLEHLIKKLKPKFDENSKLFHSRKEVEDLYQNISKFATINGLTIIDIKKNERKAVINKEGKQMSVNIQDNQNQDNQNQDNQNMITEIMEQYNIDKWVLDELRYNKRIRGMSGEDTVKQHKEDWENNILEEQLYQIYDLIQNSYNPNSAKPLYYIIPVSYKIQGNFGSSSSPGYLIFRKALSKLNKVVNFDAETITVEKETGLILSEVTLSTVGLPDEYGN